MVEERREDEMEERKEEMRTEGKKMKRGEDDMKERKGCYEEEEQKKTDGDIQRVRQMRERHYDSMKREREREVKQTLSATRGTNHFCQILILKQLQ